MYITELNLVPCFLPGVGEQVKHTFTLGRRNTQRSHSTQVGRSDLRKLGVMANTWLVWLGYGPETAVQDEYPAKQARHIRIPR